MNDDLCDVSHTTMLSFHDDLSSTSSPQQRMSTYVAYRFQRANR